MAKKKKEEEIKMGAPEYMLTYGDMMTLLLCFFVLLFSFSTIDAQKFQAIVQSFSGAFGILESGTSIQPGNLLNAGSFENKADSAKLEMESLENLKSNLDDYMKENGLENSVTVTNEPSGLLIRVKDNILFDPGSADLKQQSIVVMKYVAEVLQKEEFKDKFVSVEGHTDNVPMRSSRYPSNWELSVSRASNVVRYFVEIGSIDPKRLSASGYSEYHPVAANDSPENKAKNRRVDILILRNQEVKSIKK